MALSHKEIIEAYIGIRDRIAEGEKKIKTWKANMVAQQGKLIDYFLREIDDKQTDTFKTTSGTASKHYKEFVNIEDRNRFTNFLLNSMLMSVYPNRYRADDGEWLEHGEDMLQRDKNVILDEGSFDFLTLTVNKTNCIQYMNEHDGVLPQGLKYSKERTVNFRRPSKTRSPRLTHA